MKTFLLAFLALFLAGCGQTRAVHDDVQAPPATHQTSGATEDLIAQRAAALARAKVDAANEKAAQAAQRAAKSDGDRAAADAALTAAKAQHDRDSADAVALTRALADQRTAENAARFDRGYWVAGLLLLLAGFLLYERNLLGAGRAALAAVGIIVTIQALSFAATHEGLILGLSLILAAVELAWHFRAKIATAEAALVHAVHGRAWADAEQRVRDALLAAWHRGLSVFQKIELALHLTKPAAPAPVPAPVASIVTVPPTVPPAP